MTSNPMNAGHYSRLVFRLGQVVIFVLLLLLGSMSLLGLVKPPGLSSAYAAPLAVCSDYEADFATRRDNLSGTVSLPFNGKVITETELDQQSFEEINKLSGPKLITNAEGWEVIARTGGRPFLNFDDIRINCDSWAFNPTLFTTGTSTVITPITLTNHFNAGKKVNRLWFTHKAGPSHYPIVVVMTPDGFLNVAGAFSPTLQGAATRIGFIGEPFDENADYPQYIDEVNLVKVDNDNLIVIYNIHSKAGEGVLIVQLHWNAATNRPELTFRTAQMSRFNAQLGFAGLNFMRGPTLSGIVSATAPRENGIEAFHDGRSIFLVNPNNVVTRNLLIPPVLITTVIRENIGSNLALPSKLVMDQPQNVEFYFSKTPTPGYEFRTDLILQVIGSTASTINLRRAQKPVDLSSSNPEALETANIFYAANIVTGTLYNFTFTLNVAAQDFEQLYYTRTHRVGVVFRSDRAEGQAKLYFMPVYTSNNCISLAPAEALTDGVITNPHRLAASADGRFIIFDAGETRTETDQRIHTLDLSNGAVRRLTYDPFGNSNDLEASLNGNGSQFAMITNRTGTNNLAITDVISGLSIGEVGPNDRPAVAADWSHTRNEIVLANPARTNLVRYDVQANQQTVILTRTGILTPAFSPSGDKIVYGTSSGLSIVNRDGTGDTQILTGSSYATWVDENRLIVERKIGATTDLYLFHIPTSQLIQLTKNAGNNTEPVVVGSIPPICANYLPVIFK